MRDQTPPPDPDPTGADDARDHAPPPPPAASRPGLRAVLGYFLGLGTWGFGGPIATVGYMQRDLVERHGWLDREDFLNGVALGQTMPGPLAAQVAMWVGYLERGPLGAFLVAIPFILPSFVLVVGVAARPRWWWPRCRCRCSPRPQPPPGRRPLSSASPPPARWWRWGCSSSRRGRSSSARAWRSCRSCAKGSSTSTTGSTPGSSSTRSPWA